MQHAHIMNKIYYSWQQIDQHIQTLVDQIGSSGWHPKIIVGVARGGLIPAVLLSHHFDVGMDIINVSLRDHKIHNHANTSKIANWATIGYNVLVVDDINDTGDTIREIRTLIGDSDHVKFATLVNNHTSMSSVDFAAHHINKSTHPCWICFPWEKE